MTDKPAESAVERTREAFKGALQYRRDYDCEYPYPAAEAYIGALEKALAAAEQRVRELEAERHRTLTLLALNKRHLGFADLHGDYYVVKVADMDAARLTADPEEGK